jgi:hypothetical protein
MATKIGDETVIVCSECQRRFSIFGIDEWPDILKVLRRDGWTTSTDTGGAVCPVCSGPLD